MFAGPENSYGYEDKQEAKGGHGIENSSSHQVSRDSAAFMHLIVDGTQTNTKRPGHWSFCFFRERKPSGFPLTGSPSGKVLLQIGKADLRELFIGCFYRPIKLETVIEIPSESTHSWMRFLISSLSEIFLLRLHIFRSVLR